MCSNEEDDMSGIDIATRRVEPVARTEARGRHPHRLAWRLAAVSCSVALTALIGVDAGAVGRERAGQDDGVGHRPRATVLPLVDLATGMVVQRSGSMLVRTNDGVFVTLHSSGFAEGTVVTGWIAIFNRPRHCATNPCSPADFANPLVRGSGYNFGGRVIGPDGSISVGAFRAVGDATGSGTPANPVPPVPLLRPLSAEIHVVLRSHGPVVFDPAQLTTFNGGCPPNPAGQPGQLDPAAGCVNAQASVHQP
jgi:hypothetical protein